MKIAYSVGNLRRISEMPDIDIKPITILVGRNSAGKSTFLRSFPLLRQSLATRSSAPVLWYGDYVDFGEFKTAVADNNESKTISFSFVIKSIPERIRPYSRRYSYSWTGFKIPSVKVSYFVGAQDGKTTLRHVEVSIPKEQIKVRLTINARDKVKRVFVDDVDIMEDLKKFTLVSLDKNLFAAPTFLSEVKEGKKTYRRSVSPTDVLKIQLTNFLRTIIAKNVGRPTIYKEAGYIMNSASFDEKTLLEWSQVSSTQAFNKFFRYLRENPKSTTSIKVLRYRKAYRAFAILDHLERDLTNFFTNVSYVGPARASSERYYRKQELAIEEISADGKNFPMFLAALSRSKMKNFSSWVEQIFGYGVELNTSQGHTSINLTSNGNSVNVTDTGYGVSQLLPVLGQIWWAGNNLNSRNILASETQNPSRIIAIEQPELHLHPAHQALLADVFAKAIDGSSKNQIRLVIETHSEALINRLGELIEKGKVRAKDVQVVVFGASDELNSPAQVTVSKFTNDGVLENWPYGFFNYS